MKDENDDATRRKRRPSRRMSSDDDPDQPDIPGKLTAEQYATREAQEEKNGKSPTNLTPKLGVARKSSTLSSSSDPTVATLSVGMASLNMSEKEQFLNHTDIEEGHDALESSYIGNTDLEHKQALKSIDHEDSMAPLKGEETDQNSNHSALKTSTIQNNEQNHTISEPNNIANIVEEHKEDSNYDNCDDVTCDVSASSSVFLHTLCVLEAEKGETAVDDYMIKNCHPRSKTAGGVALDVEEQMTNGLGIARLTEPHEESLSKYIGNLSETKVLATDDHIDKEFPLHGTDDLNTCCPISPPSDYCETSEVQPGAVRVFGIGNTEEPPRMVSESTTPEMYQVRATLVVDEASQRSNPRFNALVQAVDVQVIKNRRRMIIAIFIAILAVVAVVIGLYFGLSNTTSTPPIPNPTSPPTPRKPTLDKLNEEKVLRCGVPNKIGFSSIDETTGDTVGFEVDLCKAVAAAVFGGRGNDYEIKLVFISSTNRFEALVNGTVDVIMRTTTHTLARDVYHHESREGFTFSIPYLYDGLGFGGETFFLKCAENIMRSEPSSIGCDKMKICVDKATTHIDILKRRIPNKNIVELSTDELAVGLVNGVCNTIAGEMSEIGSDTVKRAGYNGTYEVGTNTVSKEPLAIVTRDGDNEWSNFVDWVLRSLLFAEQEGITQNAAKKLNQTDAFGPQYVDMFINAIGAVGNYGEMYDRHLNGILPRHGMNLLNIGDSGLLYSHPFGSIEKVGPGPVVGGVINEMMKREKLRCGISLRDDFGEYDGSEWSGLDVDYCRALSASIFGDSEKVDFVKVESPIEIETILKNGEVDVIAGVSPNIEMGASAGLFFSVPYFFEESSNDSRALATSQDDDQWSAFVYWVVSCTFYAEEEKITRVTQNEMPLVESFGSDFVRMFRDAISAVGNYKEMYIRNVNSTIPRDGRNMLNFDPVAKTAAGAQHFPLTIY